MSGIKTSLAAGVYCDFPEAEYHADPAPAPSLSASIIKPLLYQSPLHAWMQHSRLNPDYEPENKKEFDFGRTAHAIMLNDEKNYVIINPEGFPAKNGNIPAGWTNDAIREARDKVYADGKTPLLPAQFNEINRMVEAGRKQLTVHECSNAFVGGKSEVTLIWQEGGVWCRCRIDHCAENGKDFYDYKTTDQSANPENAGKLLFNLGYDITAAFYKRGIRKVLGIENPNYRFVIQEKDAPYALSVAALDPAAEGLADRKIEEAIKLWGECLRTNTWPGYPNRIAYIGAPKYHETAWLEREEREKNYKE